MGEQKETVKAVKQIKIILKELWVVLWILHIEFKSFVLGRYILDTKKHPQQLSNCANKQYK